MAIDSKLIDKIRERTGLATSTIYSHIAERRSKLMVTQEQAALAYALENGINANKWATAADLAAIRESASRVNQQASPPQPVATKAPALRPKKAATAKPRKKAKSNKVFVVHGRNAEVRKDLFSFLRKIGLEPIEWSEAVKATGKGAPFIGDILDKAFERAQAVVVLLTPDDQARLRSPYRKANDPAYEKRLTGQARPNVLFEAGMAFGRHPDHTILVQVGETREFSDIAGRHVVRLSQSAESRQELASRLETAGCQPNLDGSEWLSAGTFRIKA